jgi:hypothetical protein
LPNALRTIGSLNNSAIFPGLDMRHFFVNTENRYCVLQYRFPGIERLPFRN